MDLEKAAQAPQQSFEHPDRRFAIADDRLSDAQRALIQRMESGPRGKVPINQRVWMNNVRFADVAERFGAYVSAEAPMSAREKEICVLAVAAYWNSDFEWFWHEKLAARAGIAAAQIAAIREGADPRFDDPREQVTHDVAHALLRSRDVPDPLYQRAIEVLGASAVLDLIGLMGLYGMIAQTIMFWRVRVPAE